MKTKAFEAGSACCLIKNVTFLNGHDEETLQWFCDLFSVVALFCQEEVHGQKFVRLWAVIYLQQICRRPFTLHSISYNKYVYFIPPMLK